MISKFDTLKFLKDYNIPYSQDHHHCTTGRIQVHCPFCPGKKNFHLGVGIGYASGSCWRCGKHDALDIIMRLLNCSKDKALRIKRDYTNKHTSALNKIREVRNPPKSTELPYGTKPLNKYHKRYLKKRKFDPQKLIDIWGVQGTGHLGDYSARIIAPIYQQSKLVSYQGRDITNKSDTRYKACEVKNEIVHHKHCLYGLDLVPGNTVIVVEGITDAWRLGPGAVATFGIEWKLAQVNLLKRFKKVYIWYDDQEQAQEKAKLMANELVYFTDVEIMNTVNNEAKDPAELLQKKADQIMQKLLY